jgi:hypothetical protein
MFYFNIHLLPSGETPSAALLGAATGKHLNNRLEQKLTKTGTYFCVVSMGMRKDVFLTQA